MAQTHTTIDTTIPAAKWRFRCPECNSVDWRVHNGTIGCRGCDTTVGGLIDTKDDEYVSRSDLEFVGPEANHKSVESHPPGKGRYR